MSKVSFTKLKCKLNEEICNVEFMGETIEVKQYLPVQEKLKLIGKVLMLSHEEDANYANPVKVNIFTDLEIMFAYTNIKFTDKQKEDTPGLYDIISSSGLLDVILSTIPNSELELVYNGVQSSVQAVYQYQNSVVGVLDVLKNQNIEFNQEDLDEIQESLSNMAESSLVKRLLPLLD